MNKEEMVMRLDEFGKIVDPLIRKLEKVPEESKIEPRQTPVSVNIR